MLTHPPPIQLQVIQTTATTPCLVTSAPNGIPAGWAEVLGE